MEDDNIEPAEFLLLVAGMYAIMDILQILGS
jgi:hypothetical protein